MSDQAQTQSILRPSGAETYQEIPLPAGGTAVLTYNDLWLMIVCRNSMDGDWTRTRAAALMVTDPAKKRALADRLWRLDQQLGGLPVIPDNVLRLNLARAHLWFNERMVTDAKAG